MKPLRIAIPVLGLALVASAGSAFGAWHEGSTQQGQGYGQNQQGQGQNQQGQGQNQQGYGQNQPGYGQNQQGQQRPDQGYGRDQRYGQGQGGWDAAPNEFRDVQRQGFHDGIQAARQDFQSQRQRPAEAHRQFQHPSVAPESRDEYREGFRRGYSVAMQHMQNGDRRDGNNPR